MIDRNEIDTLVKLITIGLYKFPALHDIGYMYTDTKLIPATKNTKEAYRIRFTQEERLAVDIYFMPFSDNKIGIFSVFLRNLGKKDFYSSFEIGNWFKAHNRPLSPQAFILSEYEGSIEERIEAFKAYLSDLLLDPELQPVIRGQKWEEVPFDWNSVGL